MMLFPLKDPAMTTDNSHVQRVAIPTEGDSMRNMVQVNSASAGAQAISANLSPGRCLFGPFDEHASMAESAFWNGHLGSARTRLSRLTETIRALSGTKSLQGVERVKFLCDLDALSFNTSS